MTAYQLKALLCPASSLALLCLPGTFIVVGISRLTLWPFISERARSCSCSVKISYKYVYIYICGRTSSYTRMLNSSLLGNEKLHGSVVRKLGVNQFLKNSNYLKQTIKMFLNGNVSVTV